MQISFFFTTRNCQELDYPLEASIRSVFDVADEIVVCDTSDGTDNTEKQLQDLAKEFAKSFKIIRPPKNIINWDAPNHGIYDGKCKAIAREHCGGDYLWQQDVDEVFVGTREQIEECCKQLDKDNPLLSLPVVEPWGSSGKIRVDINIWKWRLSKNLPHITHGIPKHLRKYENGLLYAQHGTDGCCYLDKNSGQIIPCINFVKPEVEKIRQLAITDLNYVRPYERWVNKIIERLPFVWHFSWWSIYSKMVKYKLFWNDSWISLYNEKRPEGYNPFFDKPFKDVSEEEMQIMAKKLERETSGHIFHTPYRGEKTNSIQVYKDIPEVAKEWADEHRD